MTNTDKARELRLRRAAKRQNLNISKSRVRDPRAVLYQRWTIADPYTNTLVAGDRYGLTLDEVEAYLMGDDETDSDESLHQVLCLR